MKFFRFLFTLSLALAILMSFLVGLTRVWAQGEGYRVSTLNRHYAPLVITGGQLSALHNAPLDDIFVYAYQGDTAVQIVSQIDERRASGAYTRLEDAIFDANDELVFLARHAGDRVDTPALNLGSTVITPSAILTITDPLGGQGWAYVYRSAEINPSTASYMAYDSDTDLIVSPSVYTLGFDSQIGLRNFLALGESSADLLGGDELDATVGVSILESTITQDNIRLAAVEMITGPVRIVRVSQQAFVITDPFPATVPFTVTFFAYPSFTLLPTEIGVGSISGFQVDVKEFRYSINLSQNASGMTYVDANNPAGVTIDGTPDTITQTPLSGWNQASGSAGRMVNVIDVPSAVGGTQETYYRDDSSAESYGNAGFHITEPEAGEYAVLGYTFLLTETTGNDGADYANFLANPLGVQVENIAPPLKFVFLPLLLKAGQ